MTSSCGLGSLNTCMLRIRRDFAIFRFIRLKAINWACPPFKKEMYSFNNLTLLCASSDIYPHSVSWPLSCWIQILFFPDQIKQSYISVHAVGHSDRKYIFEIGIVQVNRIDIGEECSSMKSFKYAWLCWPIYLNVQLSWAVKVVRDPCQKITLLLLKSKSVRVIVPESCF